MPLITNTVHTTHSSYLHLHCRLGAIPLCLHPFNIPKSKSPCKEDAYVGHVDMLPQALFSPPSTPLPLSTLGTINMRQCHTHRPLNPIFLQSCTVSLDILLCLVLSILLILSSSSTIIFSISSLEPFCVISELNSAPLASFGYLQHRPLGFSPFPGHLVCVFLRTTYTLAKTTTMSAWNILERFVLTEAILGNYLELTQSRVYQICMLVGNSPRLTLSIARQCSSLPHSTLYHYHNYYPPFVFSPWTTLS